MSPNVTTTPDNLNTISYPILPDINGFKDESYMSPNVTTGLLAKSPGDSHAKKRYFFKLP
eukprot:101146-Amorphochlora_amoeboformis.AAC.1